MEFSFSKFCCRSNIPSLPRSPFDYLMNQKVGLMILNVNPSEEAARIVFNTRNVTKVIPNVVLSSKFDDDDNGEDDYSKGKSIVVQETPICPLIPPCLLSAMSIIYGSINQSDQIRAAGSGSRDVPMDSLVVPLTTCVKHGTAGFLPFELARTLPEYTCTIHKYPVYEVIHRFDDCILEFPSIQTTGSQEEQYRPDIYDDYVFEIRTTDQTISGQQGIYVKKCKRCNKVLSSRHDICMYRDNMFCSPGCRYEERKVSSCKKMKSEVSAEVSRFMDGDTIFSIEI